MSRLSPHHVSAAVRRQLVLDYLHANPGSTMGDIKAWLVANDDHGCASNTLRTMTDWREIRHEGKLRSRQYYALVQTSRTAEECRSLREATLAAANAAKQEAADSAAMAAYSPGRTIHKPAGHPIPNQGGQGACRPRVHINIGGIHA